MIIKEDSNIKGLATNKHSNMRHIRNRTIATDDLESESSVANTLKMTKYRSFHTVLYPDSGIRPWTITTLL